MVELVDNGSIAWVVRIITALLYGGKITVLFDKCQYSKPGMVKINQLPHIIQ